MHLAVGGSDFSGLSSLLFFPSYSLSGFCCFLSFCRTGIVLEQAGEQGADTDVFISLVPCYFSLGSIP